MDVCTRRLLNSVFGMCMIKFKFAFCLGMHVIPIHLQPEIIIILFEELGLKSNPVLGKLHFF